MAVILSIDLGNTRLKWWLEGPDWNDHGSIPNQALESGLRGLPWGMIEWIRVASVRDPSATTAISVYIDSLSSPSCHIDTVEIQDFPAALSLPDTDRSQIGVDRYLAMLGATGTHASCVVIDAGTAVTIDIVDGCVHRGGYIVPGLQVAWQALVTQTDRIHASTDRLYDAKLGPGFVTQACVDHGVRLALVTLCEAIISKHAGAADHATLVTGGDGAWLIAHLPDGARYAPDLVKRGMDRYFALRS
jgi:type III pantothenate kinase